MDKFRAKSGKFYTKQLFHEEWVSVIEADRRIKPFFSLHRDRPGLINFGSEYVRLRDPTGYKISQKHLGDYNLWTTLMSCRWFVSAKEIWDRELEAMLASEALAEIQLLMKEGLPAQRLAAAKYLANKDYKRSSNTRGRPKREDIDRAARDMALSDKELREDLRRIQSTG